MNLCRSLLKNIEIKKSVGDGIINILGLQNVANGKKVEIYISTSVKRPKIQKVLVLNLGPKRKIQGYFQSNTDTKTVNKVYKRGMFKKVGATVQTLEVSNTIISADIHLPTRCYHNTNLTKSLFKMRDKNFMSLSEHKDKKFKAFTQNKDFQDMLKSIVVKEEPKQEEAQSILALWYAEGIKMQKTWVHNYHRAIKGHLLIVEKLEVTEGYIKIGTIVMTT